MLIDRIVNVRLEGRDERVDLVLSEGRVRDVCAAGTGRTPPVSSTTLDGDGRVVVPGFVDAHVHLDKAFLNALAEADGAVEPRVDKAIDAVGALRPLLNRRYVHDSATKAVGVLSRHGVVAARVHVEIGPATAPSLVEMHLELAAALAPKLTMQMVAFPQLGLEQPGAADVLADAMSAGLAVVGGCPYVDSDPERHLDLVFALADKHSAPVDVHVDFTDDPSGTQIHLVVERTVALGMQGKVTVGHCTTLAAMSPTIRAATLESLAAAGIALVVLPVTDLYLGGHGDPGWRSLAPFDTATAAGVQTAIANNNLANPFAPYGNGNLLQAAWLGAIARRVVGPVGRRNVLSAITEVPARLLGLEFHGPTPGAVAHLALLDTDDPADIVAQAPGVVATIAAGQLVHCVRPVEVVS